MSDLSGVSDSGSVKCTRLSLHRLENAFANAGTVDNFLDDSGCLLLAVRLVEVEVCSMNILHLALKMLQGVDMCACVNAVTSVCTCVYWKCKRICMFVCVCGDDCADMCVYMYMYVCVLSWWCERAKVFAWICECVSMSVIDECVACKYSPKNESLQGAMHSAPSCAECCVFPPLQVTRGLVGSMAPWV